jgi:hypothetical protein
MEFQLGKNFQEVKIQTTNIEKINFAHCAAAPVVTKTFNIKNINVKTLPLQPVESNSVLKARLGYSPRRACIRRAPPLPARHRNS